MTQFSKIFNNSKKLLFTGLFLATSLFAGNYKIDSSHSSVGFKVKHMMVSNVKGTFDKFKGSFEYDEKTNTLKALEGIIEVDSINTANKKRDNHLRADDIFNANKYPQITFKLTKVENDEVYGDFTMKGVTKNIKLDYEAGGTIINHRGKQIAGFTLTGKINRTDYNLKWNKILEAGGVAVGEVVKFEIEIEGAKK